MDPFTLYLFPGDPGLAPATQGGPFREARKRNRTLEKALVELMRSPGASICRGLPVQAFPDYSAASNGASGLHFAAN
jgi:hypothetical protein